MITQFYHQLTVLSAFVLAMKLGVKLLLICPFSSHHLSICEFVVMVLRIFLISECKTMVTLFSPTKAPPQPPQVLPLNFLFLELLPVLSGTTSNCGTTSFAVTSSVSFGSSSTSNVSSSGVMFLLGTTSDYQSALLTMEVLSMPSFLLGCSVGLLGNPS